MDKKIKLARGETLSEKRTEFRCSQAQLFETVMNLCRQGQWPEGWSFQSLGETDAMGLIRLPVGRERVIAREGIPVTSLGQTVGNLIFAPINDNASALMVRSNKITLLKFFDDIVALILRYSGRSTPLFDPAKPLPPEPAKGSNVDEWLDWYHAVKNAGYKMTFSKLAVKSGYSPKTFKAAHARYKAQRGIN